MDDNFKAFLAELELEEELEKNCPYKQMTSHEAYKALEEFWGITGDQNE